MYKKLPRFLVIESKNGVIKDTAMKIRRLNSFQKQLPLFQEDRLESFQAAFYQTDLGKIRLALPLESMSQQMGLKDQTKGPTSLFSPAGKLALMFLKHYVCVSDKKLIEQLNGNIYYQIFCGIYLPADQPIKNFKIVSQIRCELANLLDIESSQQLLADHWKPYLQDTNCMTMDATCYESHIRYPTDIKLLWESIAWSYKYFKNLSKQLGIKLGRTQMSELKKDYSIYSRLRRKPKKKRIVMTRRLLHLLLRIIKEIIELEKQAAVQSLQNYQRFSTIQKVYEQQYDWFTTGQNPKNRIVSIDKPYLRPIVRGKETKSVEFGAKVNKIQINGINFIEYLSFDNFNDGTRYKKSIFLAQRLMKRKMRLVGADQIYATNANRVFARKNNINTDFKRKGRASEKHEKHRSQLSSQIRKERATRLEGSFGTEKEYYHLKRIRARTKKTEALWIFFGIHTSNALNIGRRIAAIQSQKRAA